MITFLAGFAAPSVDGIASTSPVSPFCQLGRRRGTVDSVGLLEPLHDQRAGLIGVDPCSTSTTYGFSAPALMPAAASASRPWKASPLAGEVLRLGLGRG